MTASFRKPTAALLLAASFALCALLMLAPLSRADTVVSSYTEQAAVDGQFVFFTLPAPRSYLDQGALQISRFDQTSGLTQVVYTAPVGHSITDFRARAGVLAVVIDPDPDDDVGTATVVQMQADGSDPRELASVIDDGKSLPCFEYLGLAAITESGQTVMNRISYRAATGTNCAVATATVGSTSADPAGVLNTVSDQTSPAYRQPRFGDDYETPIFQFVFTRVLLDATDDWLVRALPRSGALAFTDRHTGLVHRAKLGPYAGNFDSFRVWADGTIFTAQESDPNTAYLANVFSARAPREVQRRNSFSQMRPCGDLIVELYQRHKKLKSEKRMHLALRDHTGKVVREIAGSVPRGSSIEDCDGRTALLSYNSYDRDLLAASARKSRPRPYLYTVPL
jgi:hypothetical protein